MEKGEYKVDEEDIQFLVCGTRTNYDAAEFYHLKGINCWQWWDRCRSLTFDVSLYLSLRLHSFADVAPFRNEL